MVDKELKLKSRTLEPVVIIGKNGIDEQVIKHIKDALKKKKLIKIRFLRTFLDGKNKKEVARELASQLGAELVEVMGLTASFFKR